MAEQTGPHDPIEIDWRELHRCTDRDRAISITTTIAAMGFDVECDDSGGERISGTRSCEGACSIEGPALGDPPYIIRVPGSHLAELGPALDEIIAEQAAFDRLLAQRELQGRRLRKRFILVTLIVLMAVLGLLGLLQV